MSLDHNAIEKVCPDCAGRACVCPSAPTRLLRDEDCPSCGWPETYAEVDLTAETPGADAIGCRHCGWRVEAAGEEVSA